MSLHQLDHSAMSMAKGLWPGVPLPHSTVVSERVGDHNPGSVVVSAEDSVGQSGALQMECQVQLGIPSSDPNERADTFVPPDQ